MYVLLNCCYSRNNCTISKIISFYRLALLQEWRKKYGPNATYRNLAKSFYDAGKPGLVETVCAVMCDYPVNTSQVPTSLPCALTNVTPTEWSTRYSSLSCKYLLFWLVILVSSVLLASYFFEVDNPQRGNYFASSVSADSDGTEVGSISNGDKANEVAPNNLPHLSGLFIGRDKDVQHFTHLLRFAKQSRTKMVHIFGLPAVGKSTLAVHVGYEMARRGVAVRYINMDETHIFKSHEHIVTEFMMSPMCTLLRGLASLQVILPGWNLAEVTCSLTRAILFIQRPAAN